MGGRWRGAVAGARRGVARRDSNSAWLGRPDRAPRFRGDRGVERGDQGFLASPYRRGALPKGREPARGARCMPLRQHKVGASIGGVRAALAWRGRGAVEMRREKSAENKIRDDDGGEATGAFAVQFSGSSKLVGRRVVPSQGVAASPLPPGATSPRAASPSCTPPRVRIVPSRTSSTAVVVLVPYY